MTETRSSKILGIIPARGGSKGIPHKNIRFLNKRPLIYYSIRAAEQSRLLDHFVVSTDDAQIAQMAQSLHSPVVLRPAKLAQDDTPMVPVLLHALEELAKKGQTFDHVIVLQPTCPLRTAKDIDQALTLLLETKADSVVSVYQVFDHHPARMYAVKRGRLVPLMKEGTFTRRQSLPPVYHRNGAIYAMRANVLLKDKTVVGKDARAYIMPREVSVNIDDEVDLKLAEILLKEKGLG